MNFKGRILLIDDNPKNLQVLANVLSSNQYKVEVGVNGLDVFNWLDHEYFDLLLLDIMMPDINGFEVCKKIRSNTRFDNLPIIFISAKSDTLSMVEGFKLGGQDYITKPFNPSELLARVETHIALKKSKEELRSMNNTLEYKIKERTKELFTANQKLTELTETKDQFLKFISKEISSPLESIIKVIEVIKQSSESSKMAEMITLLDQSVLKLDRITKMASYITKIKTKYDSDQSTVFSILSTLDYILVNVSQELDKKNLEIDLDIDKNFRINGNNELFKTSVLAILTVILQYIDNNQLIRIHSKLDNSSSNLIIESIINEETVSGTYIHEEVSLYTTYSQTIMALEGGSFSFSNENENKYEFIWTYKK